MNISVLKTLALILLLPLVACGGGGGDNDVIPAAVAQRVDLTVGLQGSGTVGAVDIKIVFPEGFTLEVDGNGKPTDLALVQLLQASHMEVNYTPETLQTNGVLQIGIVNAPGFAADSDVFKVSRVYLPASTLPKTEDFDISMEAFDLDGAALSAATVQIKLIITPVP